MNTRILWCLSIREYNTSTACLRIALAVLKTLSVLFALSFLVAVVVLTWYLYDSVYLRYVLLFMGVTSSTYAIRDACEQGLVSGKYQRKKDGCDCHLMAEQYNKGKPVSSGSPNTRSNVNRVQELMVPGQSTKNSTMYV